RVPRDGGLGIPLGGDRLRINPRRVVAPDFDLIDQVKVEFGRAGLDHCSPGGQSPAARRVLGDSIGARRAWLTGELRTRPPGGLSAAVQDDRVPSRAIRTRVPIETMPLG